jgi:Uma2 family endonuclease
MTEDELMALPDDGRKYEIVDGRAVEVPTGWRHEKILMHLLKALLFAGMDELGEIMESGIGYRMPNGDIRSPDISFVVRDRVPRGPETERFFSGAPDLAVEVLSPSERTGAVLRKVGEYFEAGAQQVWLVRPEERTVTVYGASPDPRVLTEGDTLTGGDLLPDFHCRVADLFETE